MHTFHAEDNFIKHLADGSSSAFKQLFDLYWSHVYQTVYSLVKNPELAEDISQEIFLKIWKQRDHLSDINNIQAYLYTIARNTTLDNLRKKVLVTENIERLLDYFTDHSGTPHQQLEYKELQQDIQKGIDALPEKLKTVFVLSRVEGLSHEEIATKLGISVTSSKTYIVRALKIIRLQIMKNMQSVIAATLLLEKIISHKK